MLVVSLRLLWMVVVWLLSSLGFYCPCLVCLFVWLFLFSVSYGVTLIWVFVWFVLPFVLFFVLHGPNLGISVGIGVLLCWVSFIGVLHGVRLCCMALIWVFVLC